jgi:hypothetical protein
VAPEEIDPFRVSEPRTSWDTRHRKPIRLFSRRWISAHHSWRTVSPGKTQTFAIVLLGDPVVGIYLIDYVKAREVNLFQEVQRCFGTTIQELEERAVLAACGVLELSV